MAGNRCGKEFNLLARYKMRVILYPYVVMVTQIMSTWDEVGGPCSLIELETERERERQTERGGRREKTKLKQKE